MLAKFAFASCRVDNRRSVRLVIWSGDRDTDSQAVIAWMIKMSSPTSLLGPAGQPRAEGQREQSDSTCRLQLPELL